MFRAGQQARVPQPENSTSAALFDFSLTPAPHPGLIADLPLPPRSLPCSKERGRNWQVALLHMGIRDKFSLV